MRILFFGTPQFAIPSLEAVFQFTEASNSTLLGVVTQPDKPAGRGQKITACPVAQLARSRGILVDQPGSLKDPLVWERWKALSPDLFVVVAYGRILPKEVLDIPRLGTINVHASLLPAYRGAAPIQRAIMAGEPYTGVTTMIVVPELDAGPMLLSRSAAITDTDTTETLFPRLAQLGGELLFETLKGYQEGTLHPVDQDPALVTYAPPLRKEEGLVDWHRPAQALSAHIRGITPWPGAWTTIRDKKVKLLRVSVSSLARGHTQVGEIIHLSPVAIEVACGDGVLAIHELQPEGKRPMPIRDFLNGFPLKVGEKFTSVG